MPRSDPSTQPAPQPPPALHSAPAPQISPRASRPLPLRSLPLRPLDSAARLLILTVVWSYRLTLGPFLGGHCRHFPTCSQYMLEAVETHGPWRGAWKGLKRICRCHPFGTRGFDPP